MLNHFFCSVGDVVKITLLEDNENLLIEPLESFALRVSATVSRPSENSRILFFDTPRDFKGYIFAGGDACDIRLAIKDDESLFEFFSGMDADIEQVKVKVGLDK